MTTIGVTGGIGSGKSTVASMLVARGAVLVDADEISREVVVKGSRAHELIVRRFGEDVMAADGGIDRGRLASVVFADKRALADLNAIVHPAVEAEMASRVASETAEQVIVLDVPLLVETDGVARYRLDGVLVVDAPAETAIERLVSERAMSPADAAARVAAQASRPERLAIADYVILNTGSIEELLLMVDAAWAWIEQLGAARASD
ncbi:MAG: dephospho-CoA kinase [Acidimicrobiales bacterium]